MVHSTLFTAEESLRIFRPVVVMVWFVHHYAPPLHQGQLQLCHVVPAFLERRFLARFVLLPAGFLRHRDFHASFSLESPIVVVAALAESRAFSVPATRPVIAVEASFSPSNTALQRTTGPLLRSVAFRLFHVFLSAQRHCRQWSLSLGRSFCVVYLKTVMPASLARCSNSPSLQRPMPVARSPSGI